MPVPDASTAVTAGSAVRASVAPRRKPASVPLGELPKRPTRAHGFVLQAAWPCALLGWERSAAPDPPSK